MLIFSEDKGSHNENLEIVMLNLKQHELYVYPTKCELFKDNIDFFVLLIGKYGLCVSPENVSILKMCLKPTSVTDISICLRL